MERAAERIDREQLEKKLLARLKGGKAIEMTLLGDAPGPKRTCSRFGPEPGKSKSGP